MAILAGRLLAWAIGLSLGTVWTAPPTTLAQAIQRQLYVTVLDENDLPVQGLTPDDFSVLEDGAAREIIAVAPATGPLHVEVVVDTSAAARQLIGHIRRALRMFIAELGAHDEIGLTTIGGARSVVVAPTTDRDELATGLSKLFSRPDTASYLVNALADSAEGLRQRNPSRPTLVVVTTTGVDFSDQGPQDVTVALRRSWATMHAVIMRTSSLRMSFTDRFGLAEFPAWANRGRDAILDIGPAQTGGHRIDISTVKGLGEVLSRLAFELTNQYLVTYASPDTLIPPRSVRVGVTSRTRVRVRTVPARTDVSHR